MPRKKTNEEERLEFYPGLGWDERTVPFHPPWRDSPLPLALRRRLGRREDRVFDCERGGEMEVVRGVAEVMRFSAEPGRERENANSSLALRYDIAFRSSSGVAKVAYCVSWECWSRMTISVDDYATVLTAWVKKLAADAVAGPGVRLPVERSFTESRS